VEVSFGGLKKNEQSRTKIVGRDKSSSNQVSTMAQVGILVRDKSSGNQVSIMAQVGYFGAG
jgi:hypothetical protein